VRNKLFVHMEHFSSWNMGPTLYMLHFIFLLNVNIHSGPSCFFFYPYLAAFTIQERWQRWEMLWELSNGLLTDHLREKAMAIRILLCFLLMFYLGSRGFAGGNDCVYEWTKPSLWPCEIRIFFSQITFFPFSELCVLRFMHILSSECLIIWINKKSTI
jgi:hypothetical protein